ncbi:hypothetical protein CPC08DRAFT_702145 [Agrocybe pediades]|nr:hypothetical protein CPC08DRAFT_702145 [Agrocybe pediades]
MYHYIVPAGAKVVFQDVFGNVITRLGPKSSRKHEMNPHVRSVPIIVHDEYGNELYKSQQNPPTSAFYPYSAPQSSFPGYGGRATSYDSRGYHRPPWLSDSSGSLSSSSSTRTIIVDERGNQFPLRSRSVSRDRPTRMQPLFQDVSYHADVYDA